MFHRNIPAKNIDELLEEGIMLRTVQLKSMAEINRLAKRRENHKVIYLGELDRVIAKLREIHACCRRYPANEVPQRVYNFLISLAKKQLPETDYRLLLKYGNSEEQSIRKLSSADIEYLNGRVYSP